MRAVVLVGTEGEVGGVAVSSVLPCWFCRTLAIMSIERADVKI